MKLRNKKTGEIVDIVAYKTTKQPLTEGYYQGQFKTLSQLTEDWEDAPEEPKKYWCISWGCAGVCENEYSGDYMDEFNKAIGNYFSSKEEAEKVVERLRAWKRLKDKGFRFNGWGLREYGGCDRFDYSPQIGFSIPNLDKDEPYEYPEDIEKDLDLLFGGEE